MNFQSFLFIVGFYVASANDENNDLNDREADDKGYGTSWMYFPDGDDILHRISLDVLSSEMLRHTFWIDGIEYRLYTRYNPYNYVVLDENAMPINNSFNHIVANIQNAPIKVITHGWESSADKNAVINIKNAYLESQNVNVIAVDWSSVAESVFYPIVAQQTVKVGNSVGKFLNKLSEKYQVSGRAIHLIGHSLGAHVMGNAGHTTSLSIYRITGLDPARPLFEVPSISTDSKLDTSDAEFVDIIHTCSGIFGVQFPIGHADFYPNNGFAPQPGCNEISNVMEACSHSRAHYLFADSIRYPYSLPACPCASWQDYLRNQCKYCNTYLGLHVNRTAFGTFYLKTNEQKPFGRAL